MLLCAAAQSVPQLALARFICAPGAAIIVPLGMAYVGDVVPYARRQTVLARFLAGQMFGMIAGQVAGGIIGDHFGWRMAFVALAGVFAFAALALATQLRGNPWTQADAACTSGVRRRPLRRLPQPVRDALGALHPAGGVHRGRHLFRRLHLCGRRPARALRPELLHGRPGHRASGIGCLLYAGTVHRLVDAIGERGLALGGGAWACSAFSRLAGVPLWETAPLACGMLGFGYYMVHNTLQTNATQMLPQARGTAVAGFSSALFLGQSAGVALAALIVDRAGAAPVFVLMALLWPVLARVGLDRRREGDAKACRARPARSRRARCARPGSANCRRAKT